MRFVAWETLGSKQTLASGYILCTIENQSGGLGLKIGDRVFATLPDGSQTEVCEIIAGPVARRGVACFKLQHDGYENWYPADWIKPHIRCAVTEP